MRFVVLLETNTWKEYFCLSIVLNTERAFYVLA